MVCIHVEVTQQFILTSLNFYVHMLCSNLSVSVTKILKCLCRLLVRLFFLFSLIFSLVFPVCFRKYVFILNKQQFICSVIFLFLFIFFMVYKSIIFHLQSICLQRGHQYAYIRLSSQFIHKSVCMKITNQFVLVNFFIQFNILHGKCSLFQAVCNSVCVFVSISLVIITICFG